MKKGCIILLVLLFMLQAQSQDDVLLRLQKTEEILSSGALSDTDRFQYYDDLMWDYHIRDVEKTHHYFKEAMAFAQEKENVKKQSEYLKTMGAIYDSWGRRDSVLFYLDRALELIEGKGYDLEECRNYEARGNFYLRLNNHEKAMNAYHKAIELNEKDKAKKNGKQDITVNLRREATILFNISNIYAQLYNLNTYFEYLLRVKQIMDNHPAIDFGNLEYIVPGSIAEYYLRINEDDKAVPFMEKNYKLASEKGAYSSMVYALNRLTNYYRSRDLKTALNYAKEALQIAEKTNIPYLLNLADGTLSRTYIHTGDYKTALYHANRQLERTEKDDWVALENLYGDYVLIYALMGDRSKAEIYLEKYRDLLSEMSDENLHNALQEMEVKYEVQQKEIELEHKQSEIEHHKTLRILYIAGLGVALLVIILMIYIIILTRKRNDDLKEMNATKDKFFSIISHDLKNPAIAQRNAIQGLLDHAEEMNVQSLQQYYTELLKSSDNQIELLYNLLNWAQLQTGRMPFHPRDFDLKTVTEDEVKLLQPLIHNKHIALHTQFVENSIAYGDQTMMAVIIRNLLTNAVKFTPENGKIEVKIESFADHLRVSVNDTGIGMDENMLNNLFALDKQTSHPGTVGEQGSGLGLIVCKELVERNGGKLDVESTEGEGSCFRFTIKASGVDA